MECNRDEAMRAKEISERKFSAKDFTGAKKFAIKAQSLFPDLEGIAQMLATLDIYIAAENKLNNESDFYGILGVNPLADDETVRKHYRKLALFLHPDKNKSIGADGAFKYISEAWSLLSDKAKRLSYDQRRNIKANSNNQNNANGFYNFTRSTSTTAKAKGTSSTSTGSKTFWTVCHGCKMQYEYLRMYLHQNLLCPNCHEPFLAMETAAPNTKVSTKGFKSSKVGSKNVGRPKSTSQKEGSGSFQWGPFSKNPNQSSSAQAASMVQRAYERVKREREEAQAAIKREESLRRKKNHKKAEGNIGSIGKKSVLSFDIRSQLIEKAKIEIKKKLKEWKSETVKNYKVENTEEKENEIEKYEEKEKKEPLVIEVLEPDFHNFDKERCETCFKEGQIWAAYDDDDGMPRHHGIIQKVNSVDPFKIKVTWLNSRTDNELLLYSGYSKAFGEFKSGKNENVSFPNYFSHKVNFIKLENDIFQIYPQKGDVWALYRFWSPEWNEETSYETKHKYEIVEIDDFDEETGFTVSQLVKVAGFKTVFRRNLNPKEARVIPESEIFRFSHRIPSYVLTGQESCNALKGCCELDPAATPDEFLHVIVQETESENIDDEVAVYDDEVAVLADVKDVVVVDDE